MKKMLKSSLLVAAAAMALAGCSKSDIADEVCPESGIKSVRGFAAEIVSSRTTLNDAATRMKWTAGDRLGFYSDVTSDANVASSTYAEGDTNFTAEIDTKATKVYAYYPYNAGQNTTYGYTSVNLPIAQSQTQTQAGVLAGENVPMSAAATLAEREKTVLSFTPAASLVAFDLYDAEDSGESVKSVTFTPAEVKINGNRYIDMTTGSATSSSPDGFYTSATVTLTTPYAVPVVKSADKAGYIYLAVTPKVYPNGGTFTVKTDNGSYDFVTTKAIDLSNVYSVFTVPMNLSVVRRPAPTVSHIFYDDFSKATGTSAINTLYVSPVDYAYYYTEPYAKTGSIYGFNEAIRVGVSATTGTVTTPALKLIEGTKNLKVTFYANGWKPNEPLKVTTSNGKIVGGDELLMPAVTSTGGTMNKNEAAFFTVYVENADATTTLTFALNDTTIDKRFILDDLTVDVFDGPIVATPVILADDITGVVAAGVTDATFSFGIRNDDNYTASVTCDGTVVTAVSVDNATKTVTYSVSENTDTDNGREGWIEIKLDDEAATSINVSVSQMVNSEGQNAYTIPFPLPGTVNSQTVNGVTIAPYTAKGVLNNGTWTNQTGGSYFNITSHFRIILPAFAITSGMKVTFKAKTYGWKSNKYAEKKITKLAYMTSANSTETVFAENIAGSTSGPVSVDQTFTIDDKYVSDSASIIILVYMASGNCGFEEAISVAIE